MSSINYYYNIASLLSHLIHFLNMNDVPKFQKLLVRHVITISIH